MKKCPKNGQKRPKTSEKMKFSIFQKTLIWPKKPFFGGKRVKKWQIRILKHPKNEKVSQKRPKTAKNVRKNEIFDFSKNTYLAQKAIFWRKKGKKMANSDFKTPQK